MSDTGTVASLHVHPEKAGEQLRAVNMLTLVVGQGIEEGGRYFARKNRFGGSSRRHVSLIEREQIADHAAELGLPIIPPGVVRSNIETTGVNLQELVGWEVQVGSAVLFLYEARTPCSKMDRICQGLRNLMENARQGVMAEVIQSGVIRAGDAISKLKLREPKKAGISAI